MRGIIFAVLLFFSVLGLSATAQAQALKSTEPGCDPQIMTFLDDLANAVRVRNRAYEMEILSRNESTLGLTCFDQAIRLSTRLAYIFSDNIQPDPPIQNYIVFTSTFAYSMFGAKRSLVLSMNNVINLPASPPGMFDEFMSNFPPPIPPLLNPNALIALWDLLVPVYQAIAAYEQTSDRPKVGQVNVYTQSIITRIANLPDVPAAQLPAAIQAIRDLVKLREDLMKEIEGDRKATVGVLFNQIKNTVMGSDTKMDCTRMDDLWTDGNPLPAGSGFPPVEGDYFLGTPYYSLQDFLTGGAAGSLPAATPVFNLQLVQPLNNGILTDALTSLTQLMQGPGSFPFWQDTPPLVFAPKAKSTDIIKAM